MVMVNHKYVDSVFYVEWDIVRAHTRKEHHPRCTVWPILTAIQPCPVSYSRASAKCSKEDFSLRDACSLARGRCGMSGWRVWYVWMEGVACLDGGFGSSRGCGPHVNRHL